MTDRSPLVIENLDQFRREIATFTAVCTSRYSQLGLMIVHDEIKPDEYRFAVVAPTGQRLELWTVWYNAREKKAEYCEGPLRQYPPKDIS